MLSLALAGALHLVITATTLAGLPMHTVTAVDEHGHSAQYAGVSLRDILAHAGVPGGHDLRGKAMTRYVVVDAADGYRVTFSLAELDASFTDRDVIVAETRDGAPLAAQEGPYRLIVPGDKREARWVRQVDAIDVEDAPTDAT